MVLTVERSHNRHWSIRPTVSRRHLTIVVARHPKRLGQTANIVTGKVVEKTGRHSDFSQRLRLGFGHARHD